MNSFITRKSQILTKIRFEIAQRIPDHPELLFHVESIVTKCLDYQGGLAELLWVVRLYDAETPAMAALDAVVKDILPEVYAESMNDRDAE